jgi:uncharacterized protein YbaR (Trm112 family)
MSDSPHRDRSRSRSRGSAPAANAIHAPVAHRDRSSSRSRGSAPAAQAIHALVAGAAAVAERLPVSKGPPRIFAPPPDNIQRVRLHCSRCIPGASDIGLREGLVPYCTWPYLYPKSGEFVVYHATPGDHASPHGRNMLFLVCAGEHYHHMMYDDGERLFTELLCPDCRHGDWQLYKNHNFTCHTSAWAHITCDNCGLNFRIHDESLTIY